MNDQTAHQADEPTQGAVYLRVREMAIKRGVVSRAGRTPGQPSIAAIMRGTRLSYQAVYHMLRKPWRVKRLDLATLERLCVFFDCEPGHLLGIDRRYPPHPRAHTPSVNPLRADFRREWPMMFADRLRADQYDRLDGYALPSERGLPDTDDELEDDSGERFNPAEWVPPRRRGPCSPVVPDPRATYHAGVWD